MRIWISDANSISLCLPRIVPSCRAPEPPLIQCIVVAGQRVWVPHWHWNRRTRLMVGWFTCKWHEFWHQYLPAQAHYLIPPRWLSHYPRPVSKTVDQYTAHRHMRSRRRITIRQILAKPSIWLLTSLAFFVTVSFWPFTFFTWSEILFRFSSRCLFFLDSFALETVSGISESFVQYESLDIEPEHLTVWVWVCRLRLF